MPHQETSFWYSYEHLLSLRQHNYIWKGHTLCQKKYQMFTPAGIIVQWSIDIPIIPSNHGRSHLLLFGKWWMPHRMWSSPPPRTMVYGCSNKSFPKLTSRCIQFQSLKMIFKCGTKWFNHQVPIYELLHREKRASNTKKKEGECGTMLKKFLDDLKKGWMTTME